MVSECGCGGDDDEDGLTFHQLCSTGLDSDIDIGIQPVNT